MFHLSERPWAVWVGITDWQISGTGALDGYFTGGASYEVPIRDCGTKIGLYVDSAGEFQNHADYKFVGGGIQLRQSLLAGTDHGLDPYVGIGGGVYGTDVVGRYGEEKSTILGGRGFVGIDTHLGFFVEGGYNYLGHHFDRDLSRYTLELGFRF